MCVRPVWIRVDYLSTKRHPALLALIEHVLTALQTSTVMVFLLFRVVTASTGQPTAYLHATAQRILCVGIAPLAMQGTMLVVLAIPLATECALGVWMHVEQVNTRARPALLLRIEFALHVLSASQALSQWLIVLIIQTQFVKHVHIISTALMALLLKRVHLRLTIPSLELLLYRTVWLVRGLIVVFTLTELRIAIRFLLDPFGIVELELWNYVP